MVSWILQGIPESIGVAALVYSFSNRKIIWKFIVIIGLIHAVVMYFVRLLPITFGVHTIILIINLAMLSALIAKIELRKAIINTNIAIIILAFIEFLSVYTVVNISGLSSEAITADPFYRTVVGMPHIIIMFLIAIGFSHKAKLVKIIGNKEV